MHGTCKHDLFCGVVGVRGTNVARILLLVTSNGADSYFGVVQVLVQANDSVHGHNVEQQAHATCFAEQ
jgi:hypothetical protein